MPTWCTKQNGTSFSVQVFYEWLTNFLYNALEPVADTLSRFGQELIIGIGEFGLKLTENGQLINFKYTAPKYWGMSISFFGMPMAHQVFMKTSIADALREALLPYDVPIDASGAFLYKDFDGHWRSGFDCTPPRSTYLIRDGWDILKKAFVIGLILWVLQKAGLISLTKRIISAMYDFYQRSAVKSKLDAILEEVGSIDNSTPAEDNTLIEQLILNTAPIELLTKANEASAKIDESSAKIDRLAELMGVRLLLRP